MKRIWLALGMTAVMLVLCGVLMNSAHAATGEMAAKLEELRAVREDDMRAERMIDDLCSSWEKHENSLALHIRHSDIEEITGALAQIKSCWQLGEYELFVMACDEARVAVDHLWEEARLSVKNVI